MVACLGKMVAMDSEANPVEIESKAVHKEDPKEAAAVKTVRPLKKQHGDWHLAIRHCCQPKKWSQGNDRSQKKLAAASRRIPNSPCNSGMA
jgi:hypothetical protein